MQLHEDELLAYLFVNLRIDDFLSVNMRLRAYTDAFRKKNAMMQGLKTGNITFQYDEILGYVMCL